MAVLEYSRLTGCGLCSAQPLHGSHDRYPGIRARRWACLVRYKHQRIILWWDWLCMHLDSACIRARKSKIRGRVTLPRVNQWVAQLICNGCPVKSMASRTCSCRVACFCKRRGEHEIQILYIWMLYVLQQVLTEGCTRLKPYLRMLSVCFLQVKTPIQLS